MASETKPFDSLSPAQGRPALAVEFEVTPEDNSAFRKLVVGEIRRAARTPAYYRTLAILIAAVAVLISGIIDFDLHLPTTVVVVVLLAVFWPLIARIYRRAASPLPKGSLVGPRLVELDEEGLHQTAPLHEVRTKWAGVLKIIETPTHVFLMTDRLAGYIVPRRAFRDQEHYAEFVLFARKHVVDS